AHTLMGGLEQCYVGTIDLAPKIGARKNELKASGKYTDAGVAEQLIPEALAAVKPLRRAQNLIARAKQEVSERRARLKPKPPDRKDAAAELGRQEIRTWLRSLSQAERDRMFNGGGERVDPAIAEAVLSAPPELSGVAQSNLKVMKNRLLESQFPGELDGLADLEKAIAVCERSATVNMNEI